LQLEGTEEFHNGRKAALAPVALGISIGITTADGEHPLQGGAIGTHHLIEQIPGTHPQGFAPVKVAVWIGRRKTG